MNKQIERAVEKVSEATVSITSVHPEAVKITRLELEVGDTVFDTFGGKHVLTKVTHFKRTTRAKRADGQFFWLGYASTITVIKGEG